MADTPFLYEVPISYCRAGVPPVALPGLSMEDLGALAAAKKLAEEHPRTCHACRVLARVDMLLFRYWPSVAVLVGVNAVCSVIAAIEPELIPPGIQWWSLEFVVLGLALTVMQGAALIAHMCARVHFRRLGRLYAQLVRGEMYRLRRSCFAVHGRLRGQPVR